MLLVVSARRAVQTLLEGRWDAWGQCGARRGRSERVG